MSILKVMTPLPALTPSLFGLDCKVPSSLIPKDSRLLTTLYGEIHGCILLNFVFQVSIVRVTLKEGPYDEKQMSCTVLDATAVSRCARVPARFLSVQERSNARHVPRSR